MDTVCTRFDLFQKPMPVAGCAAGAFFANTIRTMPPGAPRELAIYQQYQLGNIPQYLRRGLPVSVSCAGHTGVFWVMPDYLSVGSDDDFIRTPMAPMTAQKIGDLFEATLPTRKMVREIWKALPLHLSPKALDWKGPMRSVGYYVQHNEHVQQQLAGRDPGLGVAGHKKDIVLAKKRPRGNVAIYGWQYFNGKSIQDLNARDHDQYYEDYSHGVRLIASEMLIDGEVAYVSDVLVDPELHELLSDEGIYAPQDTRYATET